MARAQVSPLRAPAHQATAFGGGELTLETKKTAFQCINISSAELADMLAVKDFKLVDVHIPEQRHIPGTDALIPYNEISRFVAAFPNRSEKIVLYCRSGSMSKILTEHLAKMGYTNIYNLEKGMNQWLAEGREFLPLGAI